ncbi:MAG TPA: VIT domain-containing protein, partial [Gemmataceae bacterium]|nr:VIT domain-containing protein [Gemmataceae bacterium]
MNLSCRRSVGLFSLLLLIAWWQAAVADVPGEHLTSRAVKSAQPAEAVAVGTEIVTQDIRKRVVLPDGSTLFVDRESKVRVESGREIALLAGQLFLQTSSDGKFADVGTPVGKFTGRDAHFAVRLDKGKVGVIVTRGHVVTTSLLERKQTIKAGQQLVPGSKEVTAAPRTSHLLDWTRELLAEESPLVPGSPFAGGALIAVDQNGQETKLELRKYHIDVHIQDGFARTTIDQTYFNLEPGQLEGTFYFPLPPDASLSRLAMYVNGQLMEGGMAERDVARQVYETIRYANRDPALLEWVEGSTFKMRVFPIEGRQEKRIILSYTQKLDSLYGQQTYRFPAGHSLQVVRDWSFNALVKNGAGLAWTCPSHHELIKSRKDGADLILNAAAKNTKIHKDVLLQLADSRVGIDDEARFATAMQDGQRYFMVRYRPRL